MSLAQFNFFILFMSFAFQTSALGQGLQTKAFKSGVKVHFTQDSGFLIPGEEYEDMKASGIEYFSFLELKNCGNEKEPTHVWFHSGTDQDPGLVFKVGNHHEEIFGEEFWIEKNCLVRAHTKKQYFHEKTSIYHFDPKTVSFHEDSNPLYGFGESSKVLRELGLYAEENGSTLLTEVKKNEIVKVLASKLSGRDLKVLVKTKEGITGWFHITEAAQGCNSKGPRGDILEKLCMASH